MPHRVAVSVLLTVLAASVSLAACDTGGSSRRPPTTLVSATALASGRWSTLPVAPIARRRYSADVWTGRQLVVWGGADSHNRPFADGAAYDPAKHRWRVLAPAPLSPRSDPTMLWTGRELVIWGGDDSSVPKTPRVFADGAAYRPDTDTWRRLPPAPLSARSGAVAVWTGSRAVILGGAASTGAIPDGASYDPRTNRWTHIAAPSAPPGHAIAWGAVVDANGELFAWSDWTAPDGFRRGADLFALNERTYGWRFLGASGPLRSVEDAVWTGRLIFARGSRAPCICNGPTTPEARAAFDPQRNTWSPLPPDPDEYGVLGSAWTGGALVSFDGDPGVIRGAAPEPARASAYDLRTATWTRLPDAPGPCGWYPQPLWTGRGLIVFCSGPGTDATYDGLRFDATT